MAKVYVVHCIDTEGPLYEDFSVPFEMIKNIYGLVIEPTEENLEKLQNGEINLGKHTEAVKNLVDKNKISTKGNWQKIDAMLEKITSPEYRKILPDSKGEGWKYSWFCMDHVGFTGKNPRRRDAGHHKIYDHYRKLVDEQQLGDIVQFHHHPVSISGNYNDSGTAFWGGENLNQILCHKVIDRQWFPAAFRPGFHTERPDSHWFLEQWIPFDYGNQAYRTDTDQVDLSNGRFGDWRRAPLEWKPYHPSHDDYQTPGNCRRWITRCLNMYARMRTLNLEDVVEAFETAKRGEDVILSFTDHDYKDMEMEIVRVRDLLKEVSEKFPEVEFEYADAITAMRECLHLKKEIVSSQVSLITDINPARLEIKVDGELFGPQPFLAIKDKKDNYYWDNFDFKDKNIWSYTFDNNTIELELVSEIGVAISNGYGYVLVINLDLDKMSQITTVWR